MINTLFIVESGSILFALSIGLIHIAIKKNWKYLESTMGILGLIIIVGSIYMMFAGKW